jgi:hypothetical protein
MPTTWDVLGILWIVHLISYSWGVANESSEPGASTLAWWAAFGLTTPTTTLFFGPLMKDVPRAMERPYIAGQTQWPAIEGWRRFGYAAWPEKWHYHGWWYSFSYGILCAILYPTLAAHGYAKAAFWISTIGKIIVFKASVMITQREHVD